MKGLSLCCAVFLLVFLGGLGLTLFRYGDQEREKKGNAEAQIRRKGNDALSERTPVRRDLPPLRLPDGITSSACPENSWEYTGEIASNFVSARGRLSAWLQNSSWIPEKQITLDAHRMPQVILTFRNDEYELTLLLWKIQTDRTRFSYRRDRTPDWKGEMIP